VQRRGDEELPFDPDLGVTGARVASGREVLAAVAAVAAGGALGGSARYGLERAFPVPGSGFPWATFVVNVAGAFVLSVVLVLIVGVRPQRRYLRPFLAIGFLGSFTTYSTWMLEVHDLVVADRMGLAGAYLGSSLVAGLAAAGAGLLVGRAALQALTARAGGSGPRASS